MWKPGWATWAAALGFALGGFFDGILLHQILQWHHLLSLVRGIGDLPPRCCGMATSIS
jgi:uncharacterized membrane protein